MATFVREQSKIQSKMQSKSQSIVQSIVQSMVQSIVQSPAFTVNLLFINIVEMDILSEHRSKSRGIGNVPLVT